MRNGVKGITIHSLDKYRKEEISPKQESIIFLAQATNLKPEDFASSVGVPLFINSIINNNHTLSEDRKKELYKISERSKAPDEALYIPSMIQHNPKLIPSEGWVKNLLGNFYIYHHSLSGNGRIARGHMSIHTINKHNFSVDCTWKIEKDAPATKYKGVAFIISRKLYFFLESEDFREIVVIITNSPEEIVSKNSLTLHGIISAGDDSRRHLRPIPASSLVYIHPIPKSIPTKTIQEDVCVIRSNELTQELRNSDYDAIRYHKDLVEYLEPNPEFKKILRSDTPERNIYRKHLKSSDTRKNRRVPKFNRFARKFNKD
ncbi:hypothetical protein [Desulfovibrio sp. JC022]|uniref:hypothetical protein n=1 Tax=Desulfovibrio sp. JC022 TaxID=2593642 RepID=UPI0013D81225|nr:hypothetical protein [Desulfovibrio sp. JC022]NDV24621.1 hypothetical protein [Desulfovibrio sp. JC022]